MSRRRRGFVFIFIFGTFLLTVLLINFFHTEKGPRCSSSCPACHLQQTSLAAGLAPVLHLPQLLLLEILVPADFLPETFAFTVDLVNRSPPFC